MLEVLRWHCLQRRYCSHWSRRKSLSEALRRGSKSSHYRWSLHSCWGLARKLVQWKGYKRKVTPGSCPPGAYTRLSSPTCSLSRSMVLPAGHPSLAFPASKPLTPPHPQWIKGLDSVLSQHGPSPPTQPHPQKASENTEQPSSKDSVFATLPCGCTFSWQAPKRQFEREIRPSKCWLTVNTPADS